MALRQDDGFRGRADDVYEILVRAHRDLDEAESAALATRLVLILANEVGDLDVIREAVALARRTVRMEVVTDPPLSKTSVRTGSSSDR